MLGLEVMLELRLALGLELGLELGIKLWLELGLELGLKLWLGARARAVRKAGGWGYRPSVGSVHVLVDVRDALSGVVAVSLAQVQLGTSMQAPQFLPWQL